MSCARVAIKTCDVIPVRKGYYICRKWGTPDVAGGRITVSVNTVTVSECRVGVYVFDI